MTQSTAPSKRPPKHEFDGEDSASIFITRHGETALNKDGKLRGWADPPLNSTGMAQAREAGEFFEDIKVDRIYSSDLKRSMQTAKSISETTGAPVEQMIALRPMNYGDWNGQLLTVVGPLMDKLQEKWKTNPDASPPNGESFTKFQKRLINFYETVIKSLDAQDSVVLTCHLSVFNFLACYILNNRKPLEGDDLDKLGNVTQEEGSISKVKYDPKTDDSQFQFMNILSTQDGEEENSKEEDENGSALGKRDGKKEEKKSTSSFSQALSRK